ncbi:hypothetical protein ACLMJK_000412 [Lecanora helva]
MAPDRFSRGAELYIAPATGTEGQDDNADIAEVPRLLSQRESCFAHNAHRPLQPYSAADDASGSSSKGSVEESATTKFQERYTLCLYMTRFAWDVIREEVMDWRDPFWTSMDLPGESAYVKFCLPLWKANDMVQMPGTHDHRLQSVAKLVAVQLLASCFTSSWRMSDVISSDPRDAGDEVVGGDGKDIRLVSSLRLHTQWAHFPAHGHAARNNSIASSEADRNGS